MTTSQPFNILFLAAGYGTRLHKDIAADPTNTYTPLSTTPKALLPLAGTPLLTHWLTLFRSSLPTYDPSSTYLVTNALHHPQFLAWASTNNIPTSQILNNGTTTNETRRGAVGDLAAAIAHFNLQEKDLLITAGDTLFLKDFSLSKFLNLASSTPGSLVTCYSISDAETSKYGILEVADPANLPSTPQRIIRMLEKPSSSSTTSRLACPCFYYLRSEALPLVQTFLTEKRSTNASLAEIDASGKFLAWLVERQTVHATPVSGRLDIGGLKSFIEAEAYMSAIDTHET
ncbi:hypothetical protein HDV00_011145 [Rhizophlyctis rosea]|nr:hypothetical protein HDV00_011145 [Rhizophlyctis rosea]